MSLGHGIHVLDRSGFIYTRALVDTYLVPVYHMFCCARLYRTRVLIVMMWQSEGPVIYNLEVKEVPSLLTSSVYFRILSVYMNFKLIVTSSSMLLRAFDDAGTPIYGIQTCQSVSSI
jgi:hypothetical protein